MSQVMMANVAPFVPSQDEATPGSSSSPSPPGNEGDALFEALRKQIDFYFSRQNIATDVYLLGQMNAQKYVPVEVIANFPKIRSMTQDRELVVKVMRACANCMLDEQGQMVKPNVKTERNTLILRDVAETTPESEVRAIFEAPGCAAVVSCRPDVHNTWFVAFDSEDAAKSTVLALTGRTFQGKPVRVGIKSESILRSYFYSPQTAVGDGVGAGAGSWNGTGYFDPSINPYAQYPYGYYPYGSQGYVPGHAKDSNGNNNNSNRGGRNRRNNNAPNGNGNNSNSNSSTPQMNGTAAPAAAGGDRRKSARKNGADSVAGSAAVEATSTPNGVRPHGSSKSRKTKMNGVAPQPQLGPEHFPALPASGASKASGGYTRPFLQYSREFMSKTINEMYAQAKVTKPGTFEVPNCAVVSDTPISKCQLTQPFPIMFPASPSPLLAATPSTAGIPDLDLGRDVRSPSLTASAGGRSPSFTASAGGVQLSRFSPSFSYSAHSSMSKQLRSVPESNLPASASPTASNRNGRGTTVSPKSAEQQVSPVAASSISTSAIFATPSPTSAAVATGSAIASVAAVTAPAPAADAAASQSGSQTPTDNSSAKPPVKAWKQLPALAGKPSAAAAVAAAPSSSPKPSQPVASNQATAQGSPSSTKSKSSAPNSATAAKPAASESKASTPSAQKSANVPVWPAIENKKAAAAVSPASASSAAVTPNSAASASGLTVSTNASPKTSPSPSPSSASSVDSKPSKAASTPSSNAVAAAATAPSPSPSGSAPQKLSYAQLLKNSAPKP